MLAKLANTLRGISVGLKLSATLVMVVLISIGVVSFLHNRITSQYLDIHGRDMIEKELVTVSRMVYLNLVPAPDYHQAMGQALEKLGKLAFGGEVVYAVDQDGRLVVPAAFRQSTLPSPAVRRQMLRRGQGLLRLRLEGRETWLAFRRLADLPFLVVVQAGRQAILGDALAALRSTVALSAVAMSAVVALLAILLARVVLVKPLRRLTAEAERVAAGDLTPPRPLDNRRDELGRLSLSLNRMARAAQRMVAEARASQSRFQRLFTDSRDALFIINDEGRIVDVNPAAVAIFGYSRREDMLALPDTRGLFVKQKERDYYLEILQDQGFVKDFPATMRRADGSHFEALITANLRGRQARFGIVRDVTQMRAAQRALMESEERYRRFIENAPDIIFRWDIQGRRYQYISPAVQHIVGYQPQELMNNLDIFPRLLHPRWRDQIIRAWKDLLRGKGPDFLEQEYQVFSRSGQTIWVRERSMLVRDPAGRAVAVEGFITDISERKKVELALIKGREMVESVLRGLPVAVMVLDREHRVVHWNRAMENLTGLPASQVVDSDQPWRPFYPSPRPVLADLIIDMDWDSIKHLYGDKGLKRSQLIGGGLEGEDFFPKLDNRYLYFLAAPILDEDWRVAGAVETLLDFTDKRRLEDELRRLSVTDDLTGLYNQRSFYDTLVREVEEARRYGTPLSLLLMDLDHFKSYNDRFGHLEGDRVLAACADIVKKQVRSSDLACRYGGEELVVLLPHTSLEEATVVAERIRRAVEEIRFPQPGRESPADVGRITLCVGVALFQEGMSLEDLVRRADEAMYFAKERGRNRVAVCYPDGSLQVVPASRRRRAS